MSLMTRDDVRRWLEGYEQAWRSAGTGGLADLFSDEVTYVASPWAEPVEGLPALAEFWDAERDGPDETFGISTEIVAVEGDTAVVRVQVDYETSDAGSWRDLWVIRLGADGRCSDFEEWPFAPGQDDEH
jgi:ketosteroid isomerase-like protein